MADERDQEAKTVKEDAGLPVDLPTIKNLFPGVTGVLLSDQIQRYCADDPKLISPFKPENLRPAGYDLTVGSHYAKGEQIETIKEGEVFEIEPYSVTVIEIHETLNVPEFLIGRWNIRVDLAYTGLLWVGGAQVDPGFKGKLACPIYNLSAKKVALFGGKPLAMIDFVTTTPFLEGKSIRFKRKDRKFSDYVKGLKSGVAEQLNHVTMSVDNLKQKQTLDLDKLRQDVTDKQASLRDVIKDEQTKLSDRVDEKVSYQGNRMDTFVSLMFTVVAVLFAGLGIVATKGNNDSSPFAMPAFLAAGALYLSLRAFVISQDGQATATAGNANAISRFFLSSKPREPMICLSLIFVGVLFYCVQTYLRNDKDYPIGAGNPESRQTERGSAQQAVPRQKCCTD